MAVDAPRGETARASSEAGWRAMGSDVHVIAVGTDSARHLEFARAQLEHFELLWSRFLPNSEVNRLNDAGSKAVRCSQPTLDLIDHMVRGWHATGGAFDPTMLDAIVALGYPTPAPLIRPPVSADAGVRIRSRPDGIVINRRQGTVTLPPGTKIDPGGIGKGLAADLLVSMLRHAGAEGVLASVGGDLAVGGVAPTGDSWQVDVEAYPGAPSTTVGLLSGGIATSTTRLRTWTDDGETRHHLIDPSTGLSAATAVTGCTVIAGSAATAEVFTKAAFVVGADEALAMYERSGLAGWIVTADSTRQTAAWSDFARGGVSS